MAKFKKVFFTVIEVLVLAFSAVLFVFLFLWAQQENGALQSATVYFGEGARREYLVGEELDPKGISLGVDGENVTEVTLTCDMSSAGVKNVVVSCEKNDITYQGTYSVNVLAIRHTAVESEPEIYQDGQGEWKVRNLELRADLNQKPTEFASTGYDTVIVLPESYYQTEVAKDEEFGGYELTVSFASTKLHYYYVSINGQMTMLNSKDRILNFTNTSGGQESLQLYVTRVSGSEDALGWYVYTSANGSKSYLHFAYHLNGWTSEFKSAQFGEGLTDSYDGSDEGYNVSYQGVSFHADKLPWHKAILNMNN